MQTQSLAQIARKVALASHQSRAADKIWNATSVDLRTVWNGGRCVLRARGSKIGFVPVTALVA